MDLDFITKHESIHGLVSQTTLPELTVLTGKNGSGKSHLLEAINSGSIQAVVNGRAIPTDAIINVEFGDLTVTGGDSYSSSDAITACQQVWDHFNTWRTGYYNHGSPGDFIDYVQRYRNTNDPNIIKVITAIELTLRQEAGIALSEIKKQHFWTHLFNPETSTIDVGFFEQNFARLFAEYQVTLLKRGYYRYMRNRGYGEAPKVTNAQLTALEGDKPWDFVNEVLRRSKFDFEVEPPNFWDTEEFTYNIRLKKISTGAPVEFKRLSTGEKVLFAMALVRYKAEKRSKVFPQLILFDEPDAPLHPAMTQTLLDVLDSVFVKKYNTKIITTTHSPATVALAPSGSVFTVKTEPSTQTLYISKTAKKEALNELASGFVATSSEANQERVTFEVQESNKPIVFVEGSTDEQILRQAWKKLKGTALPFDIIPCGNDSEIRKKIDAKTVAEHSDKIIVALFDFDSAFNSFNGLRKEFDAMKGTEAKCLYRTRKNGRSKITACLLPVPTHRQTYANRGLKDRSMLSIELLFEDTDIGAGNLETIPTPGGTVSIFSDSARKKATFAFRTVPAFSKSAFKHFEPLLDFISKNI